MIPKILHFIWIGQKPLYLNFAIQAYKKFNPDFEVKLVHYTNSQLESLYFDRSINSLQDQQVYDLLDKLINHDAYHDLVQNLVCGDGCINYFATPFIQLFCDILRLELLNLHGGLYVDCDTYPIKPFDDALLNHDKICVNDKINDALVKNNYFLGLQAGTSWSNYFDGTGYQFVHYNNQQFTRLTSTKSFDFMIRRVKFFKCKLQPSDFNDVKVPDYFEHYSEFRWGTGKILTTRFDKVFDKSKYFRK